MSLPQQSSCVRRTRASASPLEAAEENAECAYKPVFSACLAAFQGPPAFGVIGIAYEPIGYHILRVEMIISALEAKIITNRAHDLTVMSPTCGSDGCVFEPTQVSRSGWGSSTSKVMSPICATPFFLFSFACGAAAPLAGGVREGARVPPIARPSLLRAPHASLLKLSLRSQIFSILQETGRHGISRAGAREKHRVHLKLLQE